MPLSSLPYFINFTLTGQTALDPSPWKHGIVIIKLSLGLFLLSRPPTAMNPGDNQSCRDRYPETARENDVTVGKRDGSADYCSSKEGKRRTPLFWQWCRGGGKTNGGARLMLVCSLQPC